MKSSNITLPAMKDIPTEAWQKLLEKKIYFGHMSVGYNILDGIRDVMKENPHIKFDIVETSNPSDLNTRLFAHSRVGKNTNPKSKADAFTEFMDKGIGNKADIAFFKFCYVDIGPDTDITKVFEDYTNTMSSLRIKYPRTVFIHFTAPLTSFQGGAKAMIKKIIGKPIVGYDDNIKREEFNEKMRKQYAGKEPIFDLALIESMSETGNRLAFTQKGETGYALLPEYTNDGGHLNERGRRIVAEQLLIFLANIASK